MTFKALLRRLTELLYVPTCVGCLEKIDRGVLCDSCMLEYGKALQTLCVTCEKPFSFCDCVSEDLLKAGVLRHYKRFRYDPAEVDSPQNRLIYELKHRLNYDLVDFLGSEMAKVLPELSPEKTCIAYMPRSRAAYLRYGFDQSALLARKISRITQIPLLNVIKNRKGKEQKRLTKKERFLNAEEGYIFEGKPEEIKGKTVLLLDDVSTTGATLSVGSRLLKRNGARSVLAITLAESHRKTD